ncbi:MAG TPA: RodZ domain-containing protein [Terriglobales bacterium]|nr:RodZ domain-containing protein [Terriglobales bacterium]
MASFGVRLKQEREQRGITLEEISATTKIGTRMLVALEQDHFDQLPGGIFNKGFIRAYARCLGLDEDQTIADYLVATGTPPADKEKDKDRDRDKRSDSLTESSFDLHAESERRDSNLPWGTFAILLLLIALGFAGWGFYSREARKNVRKIPSPVAASKNPAASTNLVSTTPVSNQPVSAQPVSAQLTTPSPTSRPPAAPKPLSLRITLHSDSWLFVTSDGHEILQGSFTAPTEKTIHATKEIIVKAGDVGALDFEFNGKTLPAQGANGEVKTLTFDAAGLRESAPPPVPPAQP